MNVSIPPNVHSISVLVSNISDVVGGSEALDGIRCTEVNPCEFEAENRSQEGTRERG